MCFALKCLIAQSLILVNLHPVHLLVSLVSLTMYPVIANAFVWSVNVFLIAHDLKHKAGTRQPRLKAAVQPGASKAGIDRSLLGVSCCLLEVRLRDCRNSTIPSVGRCLRHSRWSLQVSSISCSSGTLLHEDSSLADSKHASMQHMVCMSLLWFPKRENPVAPIHASQL